MRSDSDVVALARALFTVGERAGCHTVAVWSGARRAELQILDGRLRQIRGVDAEPLGDTLLRHGVLDLGRYAAALPDRDAQEQVGAWLVRVGAADAASVRHALELQAIARMSVLLGWPCPRYVLRSAPGRDDDDPHPTVSLALAVWIAVQDRLGALPPAGETGATSLSAFGERLRAQLQRGGLCTQEWADSLRGNSEAGAQLRATLGVLGATRSARAPLGDAHALLLRKRRQLRRRAAPHVLLDVSSDASELDAKRAYRRLVRDLHPDRFGSDNPGITRCCNEVLRGLSQAVRSFVPVVPRPRCAVR